MLYGAGTAAELASNPARFMMGARSTASNWLLPTDCTRVARTEGKLMGARWLWLRFSL